MAVSPGIAPVPRRRGRAVAVHVAGLLVIAAHLVSMAKQKEYWPVSHYAMYATPASEHWREIRYYGVTADGDEFPIAPRVHLLPFDGSRWRFALARLPARARAQAFAWMPERYELLRVRGAHDGPRIVEIRLYHERWKLDQSMRPDRPDHRQLMIRIAPRESATR